MPNVTAPTPTDPGQPRRLADFPALTDALDYAARGNAGINFYTDRGVLAEALPYRDLRRQALDLARRLLALGLGPGERLAVVAESDGDFVRVFCACQYAGLVPAPLPLPLAFAGRETYVAMLRRMIRNAGAVAASRPQALLPWLREATEGLGLRLVGDLAELRRVEPAGGPLPAPNPDGALLSAILLRQHPLPARRRGHPARPSWPMPTPSPATGCGHQRGDRGTSWLPFYHDMGLVGFLLIPMACQVSVDLLPTREFARRPLVWLDLISRNRGTLAYSPSFGYELCARRAETACTRRLDLSCWRARRHWRRHDPPAVLEELRRAPGRLRASAPKRSWPATAWPKQPWR